MFFSFKQTFRLIIKPNTFNDFRLFYTIIAFVTSLETLAIIAVKTAIQRIVQAILAMRNHYLAFDAMKQFGKPVMVVFGKGIAVIMFAAIIRCIDIKEGIFGIVTPYAFGIIQTFDSNILKPSGNMFKTINDIPESFCRIPSAYTWTRKAAIPLIPAKATPVQKEPPRRT